MKYSRLFLSIFAGFFFLILLAGYTSNDSGKVGKAEDKTSTFNIGWASADITPDKRALIIRQYHARISEGVRDHLTVKALS